MPKGKLIEKPPVKESFFYGDIVSWDTNGRDIYYIKARGKYCFRFTVAFQSGISKRIQRGGFLTKKEARLGREKVIVQLSKKQFIPVSYTVKEFYDYWLYYYLWEEKKITYNTFVSYRNIIQNYIIPAVGKKWLCSLEREDLIRFLLSIQSLDCLRLACSIITNAFQFAREKNYISHNISLRLSNEVKRRKKQQKNSKTISEHIRAKSGVYTLEQTEVILRTSRQEEPGLYLPLLLAVTTGLRLSELLALKYKNIDFLNKCARICCQLGRPLSADPETESSYILKHELQPKTPNSIRKVILPDFVLEEILLERQRYEKKRTEDPTFADLDYILCQKNGQPFSRNFYQKPYDRLMEKCQVPRLPWRKFRNTHATLMANEKVNMKAISKNLGHSSTDFTNAVYVDHQPVIYDIGSIIKEYILKYDLLPGNCTQISSQVYALPDDSVYMSYFLNINPAET